MNFEPMYDGALVTCSELVWQLVRTESASSSSLLRRPISPHTIRHTTATHLLRSGVDINTIRAWLGHVSIDTANIYPEVDLQRKAEVLTDSNASADDTGCTADLTVASADALTKAKQIRAKTP